MRTTPLAKTSDIKRKWYVIDATDVSLGRLSTAVASILRGCKKKLVKKKRQHLTRFPAIA